MTRRQTVTSHGLPTNNPDPANPDPANYPTNPLPSRVGQIVRPLPYSSDSDDNEDEHISEEYPDFEHARAHGQNRDHYILDDGSPTWLSR
mgnify:CR=1 FL=1